MTWEHFYEQYEGWSKDELLRHIRNLADAGPWDEVADVAGTVDEKDVDDALVRRCLALGPAPDFGDVPEFYFEVSDEALAELLEAAMRAGRRISADDVADFAGMVDTDLATRLFRYALGRGVRFSARQLEDLDGLVNEDALEAAASRGGSGSAAAPLRQPARPAPIVRGDGRVVACPKCGSTDVRVAAEGLMPFDGLRGLDVRGVG
ncbi:MAG: hypothetical protein ACI38Z_05795, partial [Parafannyhessea sp.]|uniref:hypothetical protein n=1 Tax=Parafannyhessea sp. TaxID=2847324 RepID=UPI003F0CF39F